MEEIFVQSSAVGALSNVSTQDPAAKAMCNLMRPYFLHPSENPGQAMCNLMRPYYSADRDCDIQDKVTQRRMGYGKEKHGLYELQGQAELHQTVDESLS
ncbi:hypothetical protein PIB30_030548 [Stylosanthes scabra]|uniref:Uncharacterized protein n=1 Tax=Stylosanthes scabra TaxID=79078 RepID=A0ABU6RBU5_9FABA|nr:hypothetical protein [Stylosanthes scabra]